MLQMDTSGEFDFGLRIGHMIQTHGAFGTKQFISSLVGM
jgi:hypothetical protein